MKTYIPAPPGSPFRTNLSPQKVMPAVRPHLPVLLKKCVGMAEKSSQAHSHTPPQAVLHPVTGHLGDIKAWPPHLNLGQFQMDLPASARPMGWSGPFLGLHGSSASSFAQSCFAPFPITGVDIKSTSS